MLATLELGDDNLLRLKIKDQGFGSDRPFSSEDASTLKSIITIYREVQLSRTPKAEQSLQQIGQKLYTWLDRGEAWGQALKKSAYGGLRLEIRVPDIEDSHRTLLIDAPWEILHDTKTFWAQNPNIGYAPHRRIGIGYQTEPIYSVPTGGLQALFMASAPTNVPSLDYEQEEQAILKATNGLALSLTVEETGSAKGLKHRLNRLNPQPNIVHLSCHGASQPQPYLAFEDDYGRVEKCLIKDLHAALRPVRNLDLLFLSACLTARSAATEDEGELIESLCTSLVRRGPRGVLGWSGSVLDHEATRFAEGLYEGLARGESLIDAVADARAHLFEPTDGDPSSRDWHLARLYLNPLGGGPIAKRGVPAPLKPSITKEFLDPDKEVEVASLDRFVGRRRQIQKLLEILESQKHSGALIHAVGRQGKSSLAARIADRLKSSHQLVVLFKRYTADFVVSRIRDAYRENTEVKKWAELHLDDVCTTPSHLEHALAQLFAGPLKREKHPETKSLLLVIDDFEQALEKPENLGSNRPRIRDKPSKVRPTIIALLKAFQPDKTASKLLFTSRYRFSLIDSGQELTNTLYILSLPGMSQAEATKQLRVRTCKGHSLPLDQVKRYARASKGNPGVLDILLALAEEGQKDDIALQATENALHEMGTLGTANIVDISSDKLRILLEGIAVRNLITPLTKSEKIWIKISSLFKYSPVPAALFELEQVKWPFGLEPKIERLFDLSLWEVHRDPVDPTQDAIAINALVLTHLNNSSELHLTAAERKILSPLALTFLERVWPMEKLSGSTAFQTAQLALEAGKAKSLASVVAAGFSWWKDWASQQQAKKFAEEAMDLIHSGKIAAPVKFTLEVGQLFHVLGMYDEAIDYYNKSLNNISRVTKDRQLLVAKAYNKLGNAWHEKGFYDTAIKHYTDSLKIKSKIFGDRHLSIAEIYGNLGSTWYEKGELNAAVEYFQKDLEIKRNLLDEPNPSISKSYNNLGVTLYHKGEYDQAIENYSESLKIKQKFFGSNHPYLATTYNNLGNIWTAKGEYDKALIQYRKSLAITTSNFDLSHPSIAQTYNNLGNLWFKKEDYDKSFETYIRSLNITIDIFGENHPTVATIYNNIGNTLFCTEDYNQAIDYYQKSLKITRRVFGDKHLLVAKICRNLGDACLENDNIKKARRYYEEALGIFKEHFGKENLHTARTVDILESLSNR